MAFVTADRVKDTSTTTGTGSITVSGAAPTGYRTFSTVLSAGDTVYILPNPFPNGAPELSATFPGKTGECGFRRITGLFRDWKVDT